MHKLIIRLRLRWLRWQASDAQYNVDVVCTEIATAPRRLSHHTKHLTELVAQISQLERQL
jgi:hypothetical protein